MSSLYEILVNTYNPDAGTRKQAEAALEQFLKTPGSFAHLVSGTANRESSRDLRQATGLVLKNRLRNYLGDNATLPCSVEEVAFVKKGILEAMAIEEDNSLRSILAEVIRVLAEVEFPGNWPELVPTLVSYIQDQNPLKVYNALIAMRNVLKRFEFKKDEARAPLTNTLEVLMPILQNLMSQIINLNSLEAAGVMRVCLKIFHSATQYVLPVVSGVNVNLWFSLIAQILAKMLPEASEGLEPQGQPVDREERTQWPWWKLKKWASRIITHMLQRYGNPRYTAKENVSFAEYFRSHAAVMLLEPVLLNLKWQAEGRFLTDAVHRSCLTFVSNCTEMSPTYKVLKNHLEFILLQAVFPTLCLTKDDALLFEEDPLEFVRKVYDLNSDWLSPRSAATTLLQMLARYRQKDVMPVFLPFLQRILDEYQATAPEHRNYPQKDGALVAICALSNIMLESEKYKVLIVPLLANHVLPEMSSPVGYLRARACYAIEDFREMDWSAEQTARGVTNKKKMLQKKKKASTAAGESGMTAGEALKAVLQGLLTCLRDPAIPVQNAAAMSLQCLIDEDGATDLMRPMLPQIVNEYFRIMEEVENDSILSALGSIVKKYGDDIAPLAMQMCQHLVGLFVKYATAAQAGGDDDEQATYNALQCLETLYDVAEAVSENHELLSALAPIVSPVFIHILTSDGDAFEYIDSLQLVSLFTYTLPEMSPHMWSIIGPMLVALRDWASDYIAEMSTPVLNALVKDPVTFFSSSYQGVSFVDLLLAIVDTTFATTDTYLNTELFSAITLLSTMIDSAKNIPGALSLLIPRVLPLIFTRFGTAEKEKVKARLLEVPMSCLYNDPITTMQTFASLNLQETFFQQLFEYLKYFDRDYARRMLVLSFAEVMHLPVELMPEVVKNNLGSMFQQMVRELVMIEEDSERVERNGEDDDSDSGFDFGGITGGTDIRIPDCMDGELDEKEAESVRKSRLFVPDGGYDEDEDCANAEDEEYRRILERGGGDMDDMDDMDNEEDDFYSPIQMMDITSTFFASMTNLQTKSPELAALLQASLDTTDQAHLAQLFAKTQQKANIV